MKNIQYIELANGVKIPKIAFGVGRIQPEMAQISTEKALESGFGFIDSCISYGNQSYVGKGVQEYLQKSDKKRSELVLTQKLGGFELGYDKVLKSFEESCQNYGTEYLDVMLIYYPRENNPYNFRYVIDAWRALEKLYKQNKVKVIGVSNFSVENLMKLLAYAEIKPMINQIELHPFYQQRMLARFCKDNNIQVEAWSPLMYVVNENILKELGEKYNKSSAQIALRWSVQK